ncbi:unnamed protein product, partial [Meganyctiphanes norvegica]
SCNMNSDGGGHSLRRHLPVRPSPKRTRKTEVKKERSDGLNVHNKNFYIASYPVVLVFNVIRSFLYHLLLIIKTLFRAGTYLLQSRKESGVIVTEVDSGERLLSGVTTGCGASSGGEGAVWGQENKECHQQVVPITAEMHRATTNPGPGDPLLAKQKHHHRKAFEYISKALKIDEENEG